MQTGPQSQPKQTHAPRNILVTGGAGFIGSHVVAALVKRFPHYRVVSLDKLDYCSSLENLGDVASSPNFRFVRGDIRNADLINLIMRDEAIDTVLHLAAQTHVDNSFGNSIEFTQSNVLGTHVLLECARVNKVRRFVHVSTDEVYGEVPDGANSERSLLEPTNPYAATKAAAEFLVKAYHRSFGLPVVITRGNNVYGPHQYPEKLVPKFVCRLMDDRPCCVHGDGESKRMFLYVDDVADAMLHITHHGEVGEIYNIGCDNEHSVKEVAAALLRIMGKPAGLVEHVEDRAFNDCRYSIDSGKLHALGWRPKVAWEDGLRRTIDWYARHRDRWQNVGAALVPHPKV